MYTFRTFKATIVTKTTGIISRETIPLIPSSWVIAPYFLKKRRKTSWTGKEIKLLCPRAARVGSEWQWRICGRTGGGGGRVFTGQLQTGIGRDKIKSQPNYNSTIFPSVVINKNYYYDSLFTVQQAYNFLNTNNTHTQKKFREKKNANFFFLNLLSSHL